MLFCVRRNTVFVISAETRAENTKHLEFGWIHTFVVYCNHRKNSRTCADLNAWTNELRLRIKHMGNCQSTLLHLLRAMFIVQVSFYEGLTLFKHKVVQKFISFRLSTTHHNNLLLHLPLIQLVYLHLGQGLLTQFLLNLSFLSSHHCGIRISKQSCAKIIKLASLLKIKCGSMWMGIYTYD